MAGDSFLTSRAPLRLVAALCVLAAFWGFALCVVQRDMLAPAHVEHGVPPASPAPNAASESEAPPPESAHPIQSADATDPSPRSFEEECAAEDAAPAGAPSWAPLIARLKNDGFDESRLQAAFAALESPPQPRFMGQKAVELYGRYGKASLVVADSEKTAFAPPNYTRVAGGVSVAAGRRVIDGNKKLFEGLYKRYGVPAPFIVAVLMVETGIGKDLGRRSALLALGSMAAAASLDDVLPVVTGITSNKRDMDEKIRARSEWAYNELKALLTYAETLGKDAWTIPGSVYGAIGLCQFMPSNVDRYGVSMHKNKRAPDLFALPDAAASIAKYLSAHGWKTAATPRAQLAVIRAYNHCDIYAATVYGVAMSLMSPGARIVGQPAPQNGNAVQAARETAKTFASPGKNKIAPIKNLRRYESLLE